MKIALLDDYQDVARKLDCFHLLSGHEVKVFNNTVKGLGQLTARLAQMEGLVLIHERTQITRQLLDKLPQLKLISQIGPVSRQIDLDACTQKRVVVMGGVNDPVPVAELTWALIMAAQRRLPQYIASLKFGVWQQSGLKSSDLPSNFGLGRRLHGLTLGVWGFGRVGKLVAAYGKAFGMRVVIWGSDASMTLAQEMGYEVAESRVRFFAEADILTLHLRLDEETEGLIDRDDLGQMKTTALLVNTARAELIEQDALERALMAGRPGMAAVDVFQLEPILQGHALLRMENVICTPHIGFVELQNYEAMFEAAFQNIEAWVQGQPQNVLNPEVLR